MHNKSAHEMSDAQISCTKVLKLLRVHVIFKKNMRFIIGLIRGLSLFRIEHKPDVLIWSNVVR